MMDQLTFERENRERVHLVETSFGPSGGPLLKPGRVLIGKGRLMKQNRDKKQQKAFFLFNDILVYGSIILNGRWYKNQNIIPLEDIQLEDMEDSDTVKYQWLIRTPFKSFFVFAPSLEEKRAWMNHIEECRTSLLQASSRRPSGRFAVSWIPDQAAFKCMRCFKKFSATKRRHHCRKCGFLVCANCSKERAVIGHIHPTKQLRICNICTTRGKEEEVIRQRGNSAEDDEMVSSDEEERAQTHSATSWLDTRRGTWKKMDIYDYPRPLSQ